MQQTLVVGVDIAKKDFAVAYRVGAVTVDLGKFDNNAEGYAALQSRLAQACTEHGLNQIQVVLEATGGYEAALLAYAYGQGWGVSLPNPKKVRDWAKGAQGAPRYRVKTDRVDARILAHYGVAPRGYPQPPVRPQLAVEVTQLDSLLKRRLDLEQTLHQEQTRLSEMAGRPGLAPQVEESLRQVIEALTQAVAKAMRRGWWPISVSTRNLTKVAAVCVNMLVSPKWATAKSAVSFIWARLAVSAGIIPSNPFINDSWAAAKQKKLHSSLPPAKFSFGPGPFSLAKLPGILIFIKLGLDKRERIFGRDAD